MVFSRESQTLNSKSEIEGVRFGESNNVGSKVLSYQ